jgi:branched-chain amino acid transport system permease protein
VDQAAAVVSEPTPAGRLLSSDLFRRARLTMGPAVVILAVQLVCFPVPLGIFARGLIIGALSALVALGMALVYRSNRILNFAQADLGTLPVVLVLMLMSTTIGWGWSYYLAVPIGLLGSVLLGAVVELAIIRRFFHAPRLILTVATIGLAQLLAAGAIFLPRLWSDDTILAPRIDPPFHAELHIGAIVFDANSVIAMVVAPIAFVLLGLFLQRTHVGVAIRASAGNADRAALLGVPVKRLQTVVWAVAGLMAFTATFLRAGILGLPVISELTYGTLLRSLAALMLGRLTNLTAIATSAVALGVLELGVGWGAMQVPFTDWHPLPDSPLMIDPILAAVICIALVLRRRSTARTEVDSSASWSAAEEVRPVPPELARVREVRVVRSVGIVVLVAAVLAVPSFLTWIVDEPSAAILKAAAVVIYGILALSLVVLTGWAGQVSLGQVAFFAIGAVVGAKASIDYDADITVALLAASVIGGAVAVVVGLPALRQRGLYLAVTTFAFALATTSYLLNDRFFDWVPHGRVERHPFLGRVSIDSPARMYFVSLIGLVLVILALRGIRHSRTGRVLLALRENERASEAYGISATRAKLTAFAISGALAAFAGCLFVWHQQAYGQGPYEPGENFYVFTMAVIGGIASVPGTLLGALYLLGTGWYLPSDWRFVASGFGVLAVLLIVPSGLGGLVFRLRDLWLRSVAARRGIVVPSMVADIGEPEPPAPPPPIEEHGPAPEDRTGPRAEPAVTPGG